MRNETRSTAENLMSHLLAHPHRDVAIRPAMPVPFDVRQRRPQSPAPLLKPETNSLNASACAANCCDVAASSSADRALSRALASTSLTALQTSPRSVVCSPDAATVRSTICDV